MDQLRFGLWSAIAIHDTSSVVGAASKHGSVAFPWFILLFLVAAAIRTLLPQGTAAYGLLQHAAITALVLTLFLTGAGLSRSTIRAVGFRPMLQGFLLWLVVSTVSLAAVQTFAH